VIGAGGPPLCSLASRSRWTFDGRIAERQTAMREYKYLGSVRQVEGASSHAVPTVSSPLISGQGRVLLPLLFLLVLALNS
jgi:hypothetical protein